MKGSTEKKRPVLPSSAPANPKTFIPVRLDETSAQPTHQAEVYSYSLHRTKEVMKYDGRDACWDFRGEDYVIMAWIKSTQKT